MIRGHILQKKVGKKLQIAILFSCLFLFLVQIVYAVPTIVLDKDSYYSEESSVAEMTINENAEKSSPYNVTWYYPNGTVIDGCSFTGTTPPGFGSPFYETCNLPQITGNYTNCYATVWVDTQDNNATDYFNFTGDVPPGQLSIVNLLIKNDVTFLGEMQAIRAFVKDSDNNPVIGATCDIQIRRTDLTPIDTITDLSTDSTGEIYGSWYLEPNKYVNGDYVVKISCWCADSTSYTCQQYGSTVGGNSQISFTIESHITNNDDELPIRTYMLV